MTNRFKELHLIECLKNYGWSFNTVQEAVINIIDKKKKCKKSKWLSKEALLTDEKKEAEGKGEKGRYIHLNAEF